MIGVYSLANDVVIEQFTAFVKSFRKYNPELPLTVIQFDDNIQKLTSLSKQYNFKIWQSEFAHELSEIGSCFEPTNKTLAKLFKKLSAFWGEYDTFIFWDSDVVVLDNITPILNKFEAHNARVIYFDFDINYVYNPGKLREKMSEGGNSAHMNTGTFGSKKNAVTIADVREIMQGFDTFKDELWNIGEQPFINYCCDVKHLEKIRVDSLVSERTNVAWYNIGVRKSGNNYFCEDAEKGGRMIAMHWAGCNYKNIHLHYTAPIFLYYRLLGETLYSKYRYYLSFYHIRAVHLFTNLKHIKGFLSLIFE